MFVGNPTIITISNPVLLLFFYTAFLPSTPFLQLNTYDCFAQARAQAYNRQYRHRSQPLSQNNQAKDHNAVEAVVGGDPNPVTQKKSASFFCPETTLEDIEQIINWRKTTCGIDDATLASLLIGRGGGVRVTINHSIVKEDMTFETVGNIL